MLEKLSLHSADAKSHSALNKPIQTYIIISGALMYREINVHKLTMDVQIGLI
jgi:hypothetical protein